MRIFPVILLLLSNSVFLAAEGQRAAGYAPEDRRAEYIQAVVRGEGFLAWQEPGPSAAEREFRQGIEQRKDELLRQRQRPAGGSQGGTAHEGEVPRGGLHAVLITEEQIERARRNIESTDWARRWYEQQIRIADHLISREDGYIESMIPELTPTNPYGFTCPNCVGRKSQEGVGISLASWDYRNPDILTCRACRHVYPSGEYPETGRLVCPRMGQTFTFYLNEQERLHPDDRTGGLSWRWVNRPIHVSFDGLIRHQKIGFMMNTARQTALAYRLSGNPEYAAVTIRILVRMAECYRNWLYHDYWGAFADCDPMYAAWHDRELPLEFKRHPVEEGFARDTAERAGMLQTYWGAGRYHPSVGGIGRLAFLAMAYDLVYDARDAGGRPLWSDDDRRRVERDLLLEFVMGAEPFVGGADAATAVHNKAPSIYHAFATVAMVLGLPQLADTALRGYEAVRDESFLYDGLSHECPTYTNMYMNALVQIPERLHGFRWPEGFPGREGAVDLFATDPRLRLMFRSMVDQLRPDGRYPPLADSTATAAPSRRLLEIGLHRYPEYFEGRMPALLRGGRPAEDSILNLDPERFEGKDTLELPEILFPAWMTAFLRHGAGPDAAMLIMSFSPPGPHRHEDNLALFYIDRGRTILGDHGYVSDMPVNAWIRSTLSHNLVVVDDADQRGRRGPREPRLIRMITSPQVSLVEAATDVYRQCRQYRRLVVLFKGPDNQTFVLDIFRVQGGNRHAFRVFSELASSEAPGGELVFEGLELPPEPPLPQVGASLKQEDIYGLRDIRGVDDPPAVWKAVWQEPAAGSARTQESAAPSGELDRYRLWMLSPVQRVEASNGPGQQTRDQAGRRVRYVDAVREGEDVESIFVAVHEPGGVGGRMPIDRIERLAVPPSAGPEALAIRIHSAWGDYLVLNEFSAPAEVAGASFQGDLGIFHEASDGRRWMLTSGASEFITNGMGFEAATPAWSSEIVSQTENTIVATSEIPPDWPGMRAGLTNYAVVDTEAGLTTGFPVQAFGRNSFDSHLFPLPPSTRFVVHAVRLVSNE